MTDRLRTLVLEANGFGWKEHAADSLILGLLGLEDYEAVPQRWRGVRVIRGLQARYEALSYVNDWRDALAESKALDVRVCNITNLVDYARCLRRIRQFDLVIILHSAAGDSMDLLLKTARRLRKRRGKLVVFIGNEYDLMAEKMDFLRRAGADYICSQLPIESARWLYAECKGTQVRAMPHALNPTVYRPGPPADRSLDIGFIGAFYPIFIGDTERNRLIRAVESRGVSKGLTCEFRMRNVPRAEWASFLRRSHGTVGGESGSYYLDRRGAIIAGAKTFLASHPTAGFEELHKRLFEHLSVEYVSGKCISSRHFEAIGTKTCQILLEGEYNGLLEAGEHYISVRKDLSDLDDAIHAFKDDGLRKAIADRSYEYVMDVHTYAHRVTALLGAIGAA